MELNENQLKCFWHYRHGVARDAADVIDVSKIDSITPVTDLSCKDELSNKLVLNSDRAIISVLCTTDSDYLALWVKVRYCPVCTALCVLSCVYCPVCTALCVLHVLPCVYCSVYTRILHCVYCTVYTILCTLCVVVCESDIVMHAVL